MCRFTSDELSNFNDTAEHILKNPSCKKILKQFLVECEKRNEQKVVELWEEIDRDGTGAMKATMERLIDDIDGLPMMDLGEEVEANRMRLYKFHCVNILNQNVHQSFMKYLNKNHKR